MKRYANYIMSMGLMVPSAVNAVTLGSLVVKSYLNQPLNAYIKVDSLNGAAFKGIKVRLASPEAFKRAGLARPYSLSKLTFNLERYKGKTVIRIKSLERIDEPFVQFLVDVTWAKGQFYRAYTVLLDPPGYTVELEAKAKYQSRPIKPMYHDRPAPTVKKPSDQLVESLPKHKPEELAPKIESKKETPKVETPNIEKTKVDTAKKVEVPPKETKPQALKKVTVAKMYGPTVASDDLWQIAKKNRPQNISINQAMLGIMRMNPKAFLHENINGLKKGVNLKIPTAAVMGDIPKGLAAKEVLAHMSAWKEKRPIKHALEIKAVDVVTSEAKSHINDSQDKKAGNYMPPFSMKNAAHPDANKGDTAANKLVSSGDEQLSKKEASSTEQQAINPIKQSASEQHEVKVRTQTGGRKEQLFDEFIPIPQVLTKIVKHPKDTGQNMAKAESSLTKPKQDTQESLKLPVNQEDKHTETSEPNELKTTKTHESMSGEAKKPMNAELAVAASAIATVKESNKLLRDQVNALTKQNELLLKRAQMGEKSVQEMRQQLAFLTKAIEKHYVLNEKGELVSRASVGSESHGEGDTFTLAQVFLIVVILLALIAGGGLVFLYSWQQKQQSLLNGSEEGDEDDNEAPSEDVADNSLEVKHDPNQNFAKVVTPVIREEEPSQTEVSAKEEESEKAEESAKAEPKETTEVKAAPTDESAAETTAEVDTPVIKKEDKTATVKVQPEEPKEETAKPEMSKPAPEEKKAPKEAIIKTEAAFSDSIKELKDDKGPEVTPEKTAEKAPEKAEKKPKGKKATKKDLENQTAQRSTSLLQSVLQSGPEEEAQTEPESPGMDLTPVETDAKVDEVEAKAEDKSENDDGSMDFNLDDFNKEEPAKAKEEDLTQEVEEKDDDNSLDFDLGDFKAEAKEEPKVKEEKKEETASKEDEDDDFSLDFEGGLAGLDDNLDDDEEAVSDVVKSEERAIEPEVDDLSDALSLDDDSEAGQDKPAKAEKEESQGATKGANLSTQLALAETYIAMEDWESAVEALNEVIEGGSGKQKEHAEKLLDSIDERYK